MGFECKRQKSRIIKILGLRNWKVDVWKAAGGGLVLDTSLRCLSDRQQRYGMGSSVYEFAVQGRGPRKIEIRMYNTGKHIVDGESVYF